MLAAALLFDLICTAPGAAAHYRIDLPRAEYCANGCATVRHLSSVTDATIVIVDDQKLHSDDVVRLEQVDRASGAWRLMVSTPPLYQPMLVDGTCRTAAFTGFPADALRD